MLFRLDGEGDGEQILEFFIGNNSAVEFVEYILLHAEVAYTRVTGAWTRVLFHCFSCIVTAVIVFNVMFNVPTVSTLPLLLHIVNADRMGVILCAQLVMHSSKLVQSSMVHVEEQVVH